MKNKFKARLCIIMCLVLALSCFAACKPATDGLSTTLATDDSWQSGSGYEKVVVSQVELVGIVEDALGADAPENFNGDLSTLTPEQLGKVEDFASDNGYYFETDENGDVSIMKDKTTENASDDEIQDVLDKASVSDLSNLSDEELEELSKVAASEGLVVQTNYQGDVEIVKPVTTTKIVTKAPSTTRGKVTTTKNRTPSTTSVYIPNNITVATQDSYVPAYPSTLSNGWITNYNIGTHTVFVSNDATDKGGSVAVGITTTDNGTEGIVVKYDDKGKEKWSQRLAGDPQTNDTEKTKVSSSAYVSFDDVAVLNDGSIIVVGATLAVDIAPATEYKCKGTVEGVIVKYSENGKQEWVKILGGSGGDMIYSVEATPDGGFVVGGKSSSSDGDFSGLGSGKTKAFIFKLDKNGKTINKNALSGTVHCAVMGLAVTSSGEIYASIENNNGDGDFASIEGTVAGRRMTVVLKLSSTCKVLWKKSLYETGRVEMPAITVSEDGGCVVAGYYSVSPKEGNSYSFKSIYNGGTGGTFDSVLVKYNADGTRSWISPLIGFEGDYVMDIAKIENGYAVAGYSSSNNRDFQGLGKGDFDAFVYTISNYGKIQKLYHFGGSKADNARGICLSESSLLVCGSTNSGDGTFEGMTPAPSKDKSVGFVRSYKLS